jgi:hypothetical protein
MLGDSLMPQHTNAPTDPGIVYMQHSRVRKVASQFQGLPLLLCLLSYSLFAPFLLSRLLSLSTFLSFYIFLFSPFFSYSLSLNIKTQFIRRLQQELQQTVQFMWLRYSGHFRWWINNSMEVVVACSSIFSEHWVRGLERKNKRISQIIETKWHGYICIFILQVLPLS